MECRDEEWRNTVTRHGIASAEELTHLAADWEAWAKDPGAFFAIQEWENVAAFQAHMHDAADNGMDQAIQVLRERPRVSVLRTIAR